MKVFVLNDKQVEVLREVLDIAETETHTAEILKLLNPQYVQRFDPELLADIENLRSKLNSKWRL